MGILDVLVKKGVVDKRDIADIRTELSTPGQTLEAVLLKRGVNANDILTAKGESVGIPTADLENREVSHEVLRYVPEESAVYYHFVPIGFKNGTLEVGIVDPDNIEARDALNFIASKSNIEYQIYLITETDYERIVQLYKSLSGEVGKALTELETELSGDRKEEEEYLEGTQEGETRIIEDAPVTKIVATILHYATEGNASDIHIEPMAEKVRVRFRVDGALTTSLILPIKVHQAVVARIKILSNMRLDERRKPQDGRFTATIDKRKVDFRVSTFPTYYGEKVVMRILDSERGVRSIDDLKLSGRNLSLLRAAIQRPYGMVLISGPTGSGKSTTLYSMLNEVDRDRKNVLSLEDPVEYNIPGVSQSQVRPEIGYTFANGLRTTLRQDPDVIMVGEIRDKETAQLAVQAALTGHLVLSTIHTNNAIGVIPRLIDMGVDPYLIPPTLILAAAQRLVVQLCEGGGKPIPVEGSIKMMYDRQFSDVPSEFKTDFPAFENVYEATPMPQYPKGISGRVAVFEVLEMNRELEGAILKSAPESELMKIARKQGMLSMKEDAMVKAATKLIPFEEIGNL
ncbi:MAG TPA: GspE/PulE family protein [Candidatus Paceibacterota bacterium]